MTKLLDDIYSAELLELAAAIPHTSRLADPEGTATAHSKLCGSTVSVDVRLLEGAVTQFGQDVKACLLGQAAASIVGRNIIGAHEKELREIGEAMRKMLKAGGPPPSGKWAQLALLEPVRSYGARHASTLLVFDALTAAIENARKNKAAISHAG